MLLVSASALLALMVPAAQAVGVGGASVCKVNVDGTVSCAGSNTYGQLGNGTMTNSLRPQTVKVDSTTDLAGVAEVAVGAVHACARKIDGTVWCWGRNSAGQLGEGTTTDRAYAAPATLPPGVAATQLTASPGSPGDDLHTCAHGVDGSGTSALYCWGANGSGQIGDRTTTQRSSPAVVTFSDLAAEVFPVEVRAGGIHTLARTSDGAVWAWGDNLYGQLGNGSTSPSTAPQQLQHSGTYLEATALAAGGDHSCALGTDSRVYCWGRNDSGQAGGGGATDVPTPVPVDGAAIVGPTQIAAGKRHTCALDGSAGVWCWGANSQGQLGAGLTLASSGVPLLVSTLDPASAIAAGGATSCARRRDEPRIDCWGENTSGQFGNGSTDNPNRVPVEAFCADSGCGQFQQGDLAVGENTACVLDGDGRSWCAGANDVGQLGDGTRVDSATPVQVYGLKKAVEVAITTNHACALKQDGTVRCWGRNESGQLGDGTQVDAATPVQVSGLKHVIDIATGGRHSCAVTAAGAVWCWGDNADGQLGSGSRDAAKTPVRVLGGAQGASVFAGGGQVTAGAGHSCALTFDGKVYCWGDNTFGQHGNGTVAHATSTPQLVAALPPATQIATSRDTTCAVTLGGTAWCWGANEAGQVGDVVGVAPAPHEVAAASSSLRVSAGFDHTCSLRRDGSAFCWGANTYGELGNGLAGGFQPVARPSKLRDAVEVVSGKQTTCARVKPGGLRCWGNNSRGQFGNGEKTPLPNPTPVEAFTTVASADRPVKSREVA